MKQTIKFEINLDENHLPVDIKMGAGNSQVEEILKAIMISAWEPNKKETLRIDLWTKDMPVNEMYIMYYQSMISMANTLEKATGHSKLSNALKDYCEFFAEETKIKSTK